MAMEVVWTWKPAGAGDYSTVSAWEAATQANLMLSGTQGFTYSAKTGTIFAAGEVFSGGGVSGTLLGVLPSSGNKFILTGVNGTPTIGLVLTGETNGGTLTLSSTGDSEIQVVLECYAGESVEILNFSGAITDPLNYYEVRAAAGNGHDGVIGAGFFMSTTSTNNYLITIAVANTKIRGIGARVSQRGVLQLGLAAKDCYVEESWLEATGTGAFSAVQFTSTDSSSVSYVRNCLLVGLTRTAALVAAQNRASIRLSNNTFVINTAFAPFTTTGSGGTATNFELKNNVFYGPTACVFESAVLDTNAFSTAVGQGANSIPNVVDTPGVDFVNPSAKNWNIIGGAGKLDAVGLNLSTMFTKDIRNVTRTLPWDVGAYKLVSVPPTGVKKIYKGSTQVQSLKLGSTEIKEVYVGSTKVFG